MSDAVAMPVWGQNDRLTGVSRRAVDSKQNSLGELVVYVFPKDF